MKTILTKGWTFMRIVRLGVGIAGVVYGLATHEPFLVAVGGFLVLTGLLNAGGCGAGSCPVPRQPRNR